MVSRLLQNPLLFNKLSEKKYYAALRFLHKIKVSD
jgi:hypothetical protein